MLPTRKELAGLPVLALRSCQCSGRWPRWAAGPVGHAREVLPLLARIIALFPTEPAYLESSFYKRETCLLAVRESSLELASLAVLALRCQKFQELLNQVLGVRMGVTQGTAHASEGLAVERLRLCCAALRV